MFVKQFHINCGTGDIGEYVILPGDPGRCEKIAAYFNNPKEVTQNREYTTYTGTLDDIKVSVTSTGIGGPSASIAMEELYACGARTFIRVGTCGGIDLNVLSGDIIIETAAVRQEGTSHEYAPPEYPATADFNVSRALVDSATELGYRHHAGVVQNKDSFYGQHSPSRMPVATELETKWEAWKRLHVLASEMESAALFVVAASLGVRCGTVLHVIWNQERKLLGHNEPDNYNTESAIKVAVGALRRLIANEKKL